MKLDKLWIGEFKNLRDVTVDFDETNLMTVFVGWNGAGKSNVIEALVVIFRDLDLGKSPSFPYELDYRIQNTPIHVKATPQAGRTPNEQYEITVRWDIPSDLFSPFEEPISINKFRRLAGGHFLPKHVFAYYSGPSRRLEDHFREHQELFYRDLLDYHEGMEEPLRPLFFARPIHSQFVLLAFFLGEEKEPRDFLEKYLGIISLDSVFFVMRKPEWAKSQKKESLNRIRDFWGARGTVRTFLDRLYESSLAPLRIVRRLPSEFKKQGMRKEFLYLFIQDLEALGSLAKGLTPGAFFKMLESTYISDVLQEVRIRVKIRQIDGSLTFRELSEGEQQLLVVLGLLRFTGAADSLFLLDEPDTHLNPTWAIKYLSFLRDFVPNQDSSHIIMATHNPLAIAELEKGQVQIMWRDENTMRVHASPPAFDPQGMGFAGLLTSDMFGLPSTLDEPTQELIRDRLDIIEKPELTDEDKSRLEQINVRLAQRNYSVVDRDPLYEEYLQARKEFELPVTEDKPATPDQLALRRSKAKEIVEKLLKDRPSDET
jgi:predicted ATPase